ncbi:MAG: hypothetical protein PHV13_02605 [Candidatus ainarchaeum sp.]|nr:hypothetical protein [Candidatus ainarchaeum sp.]
MTIKLTHADMRQGKARSAILPIVAKMAIAALPLVSALPAGAQTSADSGATNWLRKLGCSTKQLVDEALAKDSGYSEMKDTTKEKKTSITQALGVSLGAKALGAKGTARGGSDEDSLRNALNYLGRKTGMPSDKPAKLPYKYGEAENIVAKDTICNQNPAINTMTLVQTSKPAVVKVGDIVAQLSVEYFGETAKFFTAGWKVVGIDSKGIELAQTVRKGIFMSEHALVTMPRIRVPYGRLDTVDYAKAGIAIPITMPIDVLVLLKSIVVRAEKGSAPGTATVTATFKDPQRFLDSCTKTDAEAAKALARYEEMGDGEYMRMMNARDTTVTRIVKVGSEAEGFGKVVAIGKNGVTFRDEFDPLAASRDSANIAMLLVGADKLPKWDTTYTIGYGQKRTIGEYVLHQTITVEKGKAPGTAILTITMPVVPKDTAKQ